MSTNILFVFEGRKTEDIIAKCLEKHVLGSNFSIKCAFEAEIYQLYKEIDADRDLDVFNLIKERDQKNLQILENYNRGDFAEIYFFFDYDAHSSLACGRDKYGKAGDDKIRELLSFFDNETNNGKLYISYPMAEAIRHIKNHDYDGFKDLMIRCKGNNCVHKPTCLHSSNCVNASDYKAIVAYESPTLCSMHSYKAETLKKLIKAHLCKMNYIVNDIYDLPNKEESQLDIFEEQFQKYINKKCSMVAVLSAFPIFIYDYYGEEKTKAILADITF